MTPRLTLCAVTLLLGLAACGTAGTTADSPMPSAGDSASPSVSASATPEPTATTTPGPSLEPTTPPVIGHRIGYGLWGTAAVDGLRVRAWAALDAEVLDNLAAGDQVLLEQGPISEAGYSWYHVTYPDPDSRFGGGVGFGWVAASADGGDDLLDVGAPVCPTASVDTPLLSRLTPIAIEACEVQVASVQGMLDLCYEGPFTPIVYTPDWASFSCLYLRDEAPRPEQSAWSMGLAFPPEVDVSALERGDVVTLAGRIGVDPATYGTCDASTTQADVVPSIESERVLFRQSCATRFVVSGITVERHVDLPPLF